MLNTMDAPEHSVPHQTITFTDQQIGSIQSMDDFYNATGITGMLQEKSVTRVDQLWMNRFQCENLEDIIEKNLKKSRKYKWMSERALRNAVAMDWLNYAPVSVPYVPDGEIWVFSSDDAQTALTEYRDWSKGEMMHDDKTDNR